MDKQFTNRRESLKRELEKAGCRPGNLSLVVLTHGDNDHVANAAYIREEYKTKIAMHSDDLQLVQNPDIEMMMDSFRYQSFIFKIAFQLMKKTIRKVSIKTLSDFQRFAPDIFIDDGFNLSEYGFDATVLHIPGHTAGSIGILTRDRDFICGDTLSNMNKPDIAPNACDFRVLTESVNRIKTYEIDTVYPGHGKPFKFKEFIRKA